MIHSSPWELRLDGAAHDDIGWLHTLFATGNGMLCLRGNLQELPDAELPGTYHAGIYDTITHVPEPVLRPSPADEYYAYKLDRSKTYRERSYINLPDPLFTRMAVDGQRVDFATGTVHALTRTLDLRRGLFGCHAQWAAPDGSRYEITMERFCSLAEPHRAHVRYRITALDRAVALSLTSGIDAAVHNLQYTDARTFAVDEVHPLEDAGVAMAVHGVDLGERVALAVRHRCTGLDADAWRSETAGERCQITATLPLSPGRPITFERCIDVRDGGRVADPLMSVRAAQVVDFADALAAHVAAWRQAWQACDVQIDGDTADQARLRFSIYQLVIAAPNDARQSIGAKGLTGEGYRGLCFWDTDLFVAPVFYHCLPEQGRRHLAFRHRTLPQARAKAAGFGLAGACYPWEVAVSGDEECEEWIAWPYHELHVTCDVARSLLWYHELTGDDAFLFDAGLEILIATTRFWTAKAARDEVGVYHIRDVAGPDESHCRSDDNAYTNNLVAHCARELERLLGICAAAQPQRLGALLAELGVDAAERDAWRALAEGLVTGFDSATGLYEHCAGYYSLSDDLSGMMGGKQGQGGAHSVPRYATQAINQPDVLMLLYLLGASQEVLRANWEYYVPRTAGTSSLGAGILAVIAARLGETDSFLDYYRHAAGVDVDNPMGNAAKGVHLASAGAAWLAAVQGAAGIRLARDGLHIAPALPPGWDAVSGRLRWHGQAVGYRVARDGITLDADADNDDVVPVITAAGRRELRPGAREALNPV